MFKHLIDAICTPWAILPAKMDLIVEVINSRIIADAQQRAGAGVIPQVEATTVTAGRSAPSSFKNVRGNIAILPILGTISQRMTAIQAQSGGTSTELIGRVFDQLIADTQVGAIILDVDSPGGNVFGVTELAQKIFDARGTKPIIAVANSLMASAAYWIGSAADEIVITPSGQAGSIGVLAVHADHSAALEKCGVKVTVIKAGRFKAEGTDTEPLTDTAEQHMQSQVDAYYELFVADIARNRGVSAADVRSGFGQGRVLDAKAAKAAGMVDRIAPLDAVIDRLKGQTNRQTSNRNANAVANANAQHAVAASQDNQVTR